MNKKETTKPGWNIPIDIRDAFSAFCANMGSIAQEDCAGALIIWQLLPPQIREAAKLEAKGIPSVDKQFWDDLRAGFESYIAEQANSQVQKQKKK